MIHLQKNTTAKVQGIALKRMACVNSPFIKGRIVTSEEFASIRAIHPDWVCKKCNRIFNNLNK